MAGRECLTWGFSPLVSHAAKAMRVCPVAHRILGAQPHQNGRGPRSGVTDLKTAKRRGQARANPTPTYVPAVIHAEFTRRARRIVLGGGIAAILALSLVAYLVATTLDDQHFQREQRLLKVGLAEVIDAIPVGQESATIWDDAVRETREGDRAWMVENLGEWMGSYFGFDRALVLDQRNAPIYVMRDGATLDAMLTATEQAAFAPLIAQVRSDIAAASVDGVLDYQQGAELGRLSITASVGMPVAISVKPIVPSSANLALPAAAVHLHIAVQNLDAELLQAVSEHFELRELRLLPPQDGQAGEPLLSSDGEVLGRFVWQSETPALQLLARLFPLALCCGVVLIGLALWLIGRLKQTAQWQKSAEQRVIYESLHDPLTDLANRDRLDQIIAEKLAVEGQPVVLHVLDLADVATINASLGSAAGDDLLCETADRLMTLVDGAGSVARVGGSEFAVVQTLARGQDPITMAGSIMAAFDEPFLLGGDAVRIRCSLGTAASESGVDGAELLRRASVALLRARTGGPGQHALFTEAMDAQVLRRDRLEKDLRRALETPGELTVAYQAVIAADGNRLLGAEALVRWRHPAEGNIPPDAFIAIAEERGLIDALGEFVLREACRCALSCQLPWVAVNASPIQLRNPAFFDLVISILTETGLEAHRLQLEITEGSLLENTGAAQLMLQRLRHRGIRIALDDFGTGFSSMNYLAKYTVDKIKIDKSFVAQLATSAQSRAIVKAIVSLAYAFHLDTTAEGVETLDQQNHLSAIGCHELQGYLFSRPLDYAAFAQLVARMRDAPAIHAQKLIA